MWNSVVLSYMTMNEACIYLSNEPVEYSLVQLVFFVTESNIMQCQCYSMPRWRWLAAYHATWSTSSCLFLELLSSSLNENVTSTSRWRLQSLLGQNWGTVVMPQDEIIAVWDQRCCFFNWRDYTALNDREDDLAYTEEIWRRWPLCVTRYYWRDWGEPEKVQSQSLAS